MLGDLLMEVNGKMTSVTVGKPVPEGSRVDAQVASEISGKVNGASLETHYVIIRPDVELGMAKAAPCSTPLMVKLSRSTIPWEWGGLSLQEPLP